MLNLLSRRGLVYLGDGLRCLFDGLSSQYQLLQVLFVLYADDSVLDGWSQIAR